MVIRRRINGADPLSIPPDYEENLEYKEGKKYYDISRHTGVIH